MGESYSCSSGGVIAAGRSVIRPILGAVGHSLVAGECVDQSEWSWQGQAAAAHHKWMNACLRKPFDYAHVSAPALTMDPGSTWANKLLNGFYGRVGASSAQVLASVPAYISQMRAAVGGRRAVIALHAEINSINSGTAAVSIWSDYQAMQALIAAEGWGAITSEPVPCVTFNTLVKKTIVADLQTTMRAASGYVANLPWTDPYRDTGDSNNYPVPLSGYTSDGTHLNLQGALKLGIAGADEMAGLYAPWAPKPAHVICSRNATVAGTGGTIGTNAAGVAPDNFQLYAPGAGCSVIGTQTADGFEALWTYSGPAYSGFDAHDLAATNYGTNYTAGVTAHEALCDVEVVECENYGFQLLNELGGGTGTCPAIGGPTGLHWGDWLAGRRIVLHSDPFTAPVGMTRATASFRARIFPGSTTAKLRVRFHWIGVKQLSET